MAWDRGARLGALRAVHRWSGLFFAPAILFFSLTGVVQTLDLHKAGPGHPAPTELVRRLASLHKNQTATLPARAAAPAGGTGSAVPRRPAAASVVLLKAFVVATAIALGAATALGVWMALSIRRCRMRVLLVLVAGALVPALLAWFS
jgi:hypothetical protein